jgi:hypothetical protein
MSDYQLSNVSLLWTEATTHTSHHKCIESRPWSGSGTELRRRMETDRNASRDMTQYEQLYAESEKKTLAIVFACERFHEYTYGKRVIVRTKPLNNVRPRIAQHVPPRIQRFLLLL